MKGRVLRAFLVERDGPLCHWCGRLTVDPLLVGDSADAAATVDHLDVPRLRRAVRDPARGVVACSRCNHDRGCLTVEEWRAVLEVRAMRTRSFCDANRCGVELKPVPTPYSQVGVSGPPLTLSEVRQRLQKPKAFVHGAVITDQLHTYGVPHLSAVVLDVEEVPRHRSSEPSHTSSGTGAEGGTGHVDHGFGARRTKRWPQPPVGHGKRLRPPEPVVGQRLAQRENVNETAARQQLSTTT